MPEHVPVVVLKTVRGNFQYGDLGIARSLGRLGVPIYACQNSRWSPVARSRYVRDVLTWNFARETAERSVRYLLGVADKLGNRPILIPTDDPGALLLDDHHEQLRGGFRVPDQPRGLARALASKKELFFLCKRFGVPAPETVFPTSRADVLDFIRSARLPIVVKSIDARFIPW